MLSIRSFARSAPRSISRLTSSPSRQAFVSRTPPIFHRVQPSILRSNAFFSTTTSRRQVEQELVAKLESEYNIEKDMREEENINQTIKEYIDNSPFELHDTPGQEEVVLTRKFNDESIRITFSIADLANNEAEQENMDEDRALYADEDDETDVQSGGANSKDSSAAGRTIDANLKGNAQDGGSSANERELDDDDMDNDASAGPAFPARVNIKVTREGQAGAVSIEAVAQDGEMIIEDVFYFADAAHADPATPQMEWKRRAVYAGPPFGNLDEDIQVLLERYLEERGVDVKLAQFLPEYIDYKEQKEYLRWLSNLKNFFQ